MGIQEHFSQAYLMIMFSPKSMNARKNWSTCIGAHYKMWRLGLGIPSANPQVYTSEAVQNLGWTQTSPGAIIVLQWWTSINTACFLPAPPDDAMCQTVPSHGDNTNQPKDHVNMFTSIMHCWKLTACRKLPMDEKIVKCGVVAFVSVTGISKWPFHKFLGSRNRCLSPVIPYLIQMILYTCEIKEKHRWSEDPFTSW